MNYLNTQESKILYQEAKNSPIFVDKTLLLDQVSRNIRTSAKYLCITRPRRFGKTMNANMLAAYYTKGLDSASLFADLKIAKEASYAAHLNQHNVLYIDLSRMPDPCRTYSDYIEHIKNRLQEDLQRVYGVERKEGMPISEVLKATEDTFLFILDEWDAIFYKPFMKETDRAEYLEFLRDLLKDQAYVELAYMTGVLPIAKYSSGSALNMFDEYNFMNDETYDTFFGFTEQEVQMLCETHTKVSYEALKQWYDGYRTSEGNSLFNPRSVNRALARGNCQNYWTETGPMNEVADCIEHNAAEVREDIVNMVAGIPVPIRLNGYSAAEQRMETRNEILSAMVVYGFLSYHDGELQIPNHELMEKYESVLSRESMGEVKAIVDRSQEMLKATLEGDEERVAAILEEAHNRELPFLQYNNENALSCVITLCYLSARDTYYVEREAKSGKGYCDYVFTPRKAGKPAIILELKAGGSAEEAIRQIQERNYMEKVKECQEILLVGINYDRNSKQHTCRIERLNRTPA